MGGLSWIIFKAGTGTIMSRTRHHNSFNRPSVKKSRRLSLLKERYSRALRLDEWYIETPITTTFPINK